MRAEARPQMGRILSGSDCLQNRPRVPSLTTVFRTGMEVRVPRPVSGSAFP